MAEVVVVSVVIATVLVTLFTGLNRVSSAYENRNRYYDIDALYLAMMTNDALIKNGNINDLIKNSASNPSVSIDSNNISDIDDITNIYKEDGGDVNVYFSMLSGLNNLKSESTKETTKDFIDYLETKFDFKDDYTYVIISELCKNEDDCYYYALKVR